MFGNATFAGFCMECRSQVQEIASNYSCRCGKIHKDSAYLPTCWVIPAHNIASVPSHSSQPPAPPSLEPSEAEARTIATFKKAGSF